MKSTICRRTRTAIPCASFTSRSRRSCCTSLSTRAFAATAIAVATCAPIAIRAATQTFTYPSGGLWSLYGNWNDGFGPVPINGDDAIIGVNGSVTLNISYTSPGLNSLTLDSSGGTALLDQGIGTSMITVGGDIIGNSGGGYYEQTGGSNAAGSRVIVGSQSSGVGIYNISGGTFGVNNGIVVGNAGNGSLIISGTGAVDAATFLTCGLYAGGNSTAQNSQGTGTPVYNLTISGGSLTTGSNQTIGNAGFGAVNQTGGSNVAGYQVTLGDANSGVGLYDISGGTFSSTSSNNGIVVGASGNGNLNISGTGAVSAANLEIGYFSGSNSVAQASQGTSNPVYNLNISGGSLSTSRFQYIGYGGFGAVNQTGGSNAVTDTISAGVSIGILSTGIGLYDISGGTFSSGSYINVGTSGNGTLDISGSGAVNAAYMYVGFYSGSNSMAQASQSTNTPIDNVNISGGSLSTTGSQIIGYIGFGAVYQTGGSNTVGGTLTLAADPGSAAIYTLDGGALVAATIALNANGVFNQNNGIHGEPNNGTLNATAFNQTGGTVNGFLQNQGTFNP